MQPNTIKKDKALERLFAEAWVYRKSEVMDLMSEYGVNIKPNATNQDVLQKLANLYKGNRTFAREFGDFLLKSGTYKNMTSDYSNMSEGFSSFDPTALIGVLGSFGGQQADSSVTNSILQLEAEKAKADQGNNALYWVVGSAIVGILAIGGIVLYKKMK